MSPSTHLAPNTTSSKFKKILWISLGLSVLFVFITSEVLLITDYPMYHAYRLQVIADRNLLIPHTLAGTLARSTFPQGFASGTFHFIASSVASMLSQSLSVPLRASRLRLAARGFRGLRCKPPHGSSAQLPRSSLPVTDTLHSTANG
jgi:hypothetical protein